MSSVKEIYQSDKGKAIVAKGKKGIFHVIFGRTGIIFLLLFLQIGLLFVLFKWLQEYMGLAFWSLSLISALTVIWIVNQPTNPGFKLAWMVPITLIPVFGVLLYVFVETQMGTRLMNRMLNESSKRIREYAVQNQEVYEEICKEDQQVGNLAKYLADNGGFPAFRNEGIEYYPLGDDCFKVMVEELEKAKDFIFMEYFIVADGRMWNTILDILKRKVKEGVEVRFMYDGTCSVALLPHNYYKQLQQYGIQCKVFNQIKPALTTTQNNRDHRKITVIDGKTAFTGGINLADEYINEKERFGHWKDTALMVKGSAVRNFTWMFLQIWDIDIKNEPYEKYLDVKSEKYLPTSKGYVIPYGDSPLDRENVGELVYMDIINTAKKYVHIMTPYLILDNEMVTALTYAAKRGVDVKIIMPDIPDKAYAFALAKTYYPELIRAGVKIYQYKPGFVHAKVFTSDDEKAVVGTINLDYRSLYLHFECAAFMYQVEEIDKIEQDFQETLEECRQITLEEYRKEKLGTRFYGRVLRLIAPLM